jgi:hypothetical protein
MASSTEITYEVTRSLPIGNFRCLCPYPMCIDLIIFSECKEVLEVLSNIISLPGINKEGTVEG